jgi:hypothetical protein
MGGDPRGRSTLHTLEPCGLITNHHPASDHSQVADLTRAERSASANAQRSQGMYILLWAHRVLILTGWQQRRTELSSQQVTTLARPWQQPAMRALWGRTPDEAPHRSDQLQWHSRALSAVVPPSMCPTLRRHTMAAAALCSTVSIHERCGH